MDRDEMRWIPFHSPAHSPAHNFTTVTIKATSLRYSPWRSWDERGGASHETADGRGRGRPLGQGSCSVWLARVKKDNARTWTGMKHEHGGISRLT